MKPAPADTKPSKLKPLKVVSMLVDKNLNVRSLVLDDLDRVIAIQSDSWKATYPDAESGVTVEIVNDIVASFSVDFMRDLILNEENDPEKFLKLVLEKDDCIIGFIYVSKKETSGFVDALYLDPKHTGFGYADVLMSRALSWLGSISCLLEVAAYNSKAISFYKKHGFKCTDTKLLKSRGFINLVEMRRTYPVLNFKKSTSVKSISF